MISAEEIKALMARRLNEAKKIPDLRLMLVYSDGTNDSLEVLLDDAEQALSTLQTLLNQAAEALDKKAAFSAVTGEPINDEAKALAAIQPYLTKEGE